MCANRAIAKAEISLFNSYSSFTRLISAVILSVTDRPIRNGAYSVFVYLSAKTAETEDVPLTFFTTRDCNISWKEFVRLKVGESH